ncbi:MAG: tyrosine-protein phosphatase, partial [Xanthomonadales bacterium]|nr:tyrosine-protein phosphatase [Xanthomonadales bacterium]
MKRYLLVALAIMVIGGAILYATWNNFRTAIPGVVFRSAQLSSEELRSVVAEHGIRTVVNLRPIREGAAWYEAEKAVADELGVEHHVVGLSQAMPRVDTFRALRDVLAAIETPVLFQCTSGVDRSGV